MPKILLSLAGQEARECIQGALGSRYTVETAPPLRPEETPAGAAARLAAAEADAVVADYIVSDAAGVKLLQAAAALPLPPRIIFVMPETVPVPHILMAMNEGASAVLAEPLQADSAANYIERALRGPSRLRYFTPDEEERAEMEAELGALRVQTAGRRRLISYLLSTPASAQVRDALVVSDSPYQRDYLKKSLESHGFRVREAGSFAEAAETALAERPRVVISDFELPGGSGLELCRSLKTEHKLIPLFFVICTANSDLYRRAMTPGSGVDACVPKPAGESGCQELIAAAALGLML